MSWLSVLSPAEVAGLAVMSLKKGLQCMRPPKQNSHKSKGTLPSIGTLRCIFRCSQTGGWQIFLVAKQTNCSEQVTRGSDLQQTNPSKGY